MFSKPETRTVAICTFVLALTPFINAFAGQSEFDLRPEQTLRTHDFDIKHYRTELILDEPTRSFEGNTSISFASTTENLRHLSLYAEAFTVRSVKNGDVPLILTLNFPEGARHWFPSFDHPSDWATHETIINVKGGYQVVANGELLSDVIDSDTGRQLW